MNNRPVTTIATESDAIRHIEYLISCGRTYHFDDNPIEIRWCNPIDPFMLHYIVSRHKLMWEICNPWELLDKNPELYKAYSGA